MTTCPSCGAELPLGAKFCPECGVAQSRSCAGCGSSVAARMKFCPECGTAQDGSPAGTSARPAAARRLTSVLFGDLVGFTTLSESRDQEDVRELLSRYFEGCRTVIQRYGGTVEKFIGDAVMAVWGMPVAHEDDAERAVRAGLELVDVVAALRSEVGVPDLDLRVGIVTGEVAVTVGAVGQGMVAGDPVNTASRVQSVASPGQVWVDETTRLLTHSAITYEDVGSFVLKGKADPVPLWAARAVVANVGGGQRIDGLEAPLVGRAAELRLVKEVFHRTQESASPNVLLVSADPGLGKSRLGWEFSKYIDGLSGVVRWLEGRCPAYGDGVAFYALAEAFRGRLRATANASDDVGTLDDDGGGESEDRRGPGRLLDDFLAEFVPDPGQRPWLRARTAVLLGLPGAGGHPREELFAAWVTVLEHLCAGSSGAVLLIDDAQHADDGLLDFLEFALTTRGLPLFVLLLTRPELLGRRPGLMANPRVVTAHLQPLTVAETGELLAGLVSGLPGSMRDELAERAEGVPLFAVEMVRSLIDRDMVVPRGGRYVLADSDLDLSELAAPASLQALISSRLDALPPDQRRVVDLASVLGRSFAPETLQALVGGEGLDEHLAELVRRQLLSVESNRLAGEFGWYSFTQDVVRQVAYAMLARRDRREAHLAVVAALGDPPGPADLPVVAHHLLAAAEAVPGSQDAQQLHERALAAYAGAGQWADGMSSFGDAAAHYQRAADLAAGDPPRRADLLCRVVEAYAWVGSPTRAAAGEAAGAEAQRIFAGLGDDDGQARAAGVLAQLLAGAGHARRADQLVQPWWDCYRDREDADQTLLPLARAMVALGLAGLGEVDLAEASLIGIKAAERLGDTRSMMTCLHGLYSGLDFAGYPVLAGIVMTGVADHARRHELTRDQAVVLSNLGSMQMSTDLVAAQESTRQARQAFLELKRFASLAIASDNLAVTRWLQGAWADVDEQAAAHEQLGYSTPVIDGYVTLSALARGQDTNPIDVDAVGDDPFSHATLRVIEAARSGLADQDVRDTLLATCRELFASFGQGEEFSTPYGVATDAVVGRADADAIGRLLEVTDQIPERLLLPASRAHRLRLSAMLTQHRDGPTEQVFAGLRAAVAAYHAWGATLLERRTQADLATVLDALGQHREADSLREEVRAFYTEIGARAWLAQLDTPAPASSAAVAPASAAGSTSR